MGALLVAEDAWGTLVVVGVGAVLPVVVEVQKVHPFEELALVALQFEGVETHYWAVQGSYSL